MQHGIRGSFDLATNIHQHKRLSSFHSIPSQLPNISASPSYVSATCLCDSLIAADTTSHLLLTCGFRWASTNSAFTRLVLFALKNPVCDAFWANYVDAASFLHRLGASRVSRSSARPTPNPGRRARSHSNRPQRRRWAIVVSIKRLRLLNLRLKPSESESSSSESENNIDSTPTFFPAPQEDAEAPDLPSHADRLSVSLQSYEDSMEVNDPYVSDPEYHNAGYTEYFNSLAPEEEEFEIDGRSRFDDVLDADEPISKEERIRQLDDIMGDDVFHVFVFTKHFALQAKLVAATKSKPAASTPPPSQKQRLRLPLLFGLTSLNNALRSCVLILSLPSLSSESSLDLRNDRP
ncbi:hypothetical protein B0H13DRAFT_2313408 [Mycena leptocephala]|nr:hypothetical protein B0H13DRAFT_2313408 [Mycena leptocephala]